MSKIVNFGIDVAIAFGATFTYGLLLMTFLNILLT